jgi:hypothetical protein
MKDIPWWLWLVVAGGGLYLLTRSGSVSTGSQVYIPANTPLFSDAALTQSAGATSIAGIYTAGTMQGGAMQVTVNGTPYWVNANTASVASAAQLSAFNAGTLT